MVYKFVIQIILIFFVTLNSLAGVLYDKNGLIITDIELNIYKKLFLKNYKYEIQDANALKNLVLLNNVIKDLKENNIEFINKIDEEIILNYGTNITNNEIALNFFRYSKIRNEFIFNYFHNNLSKDEIVNIFKNLNDLNLPISKNNCLVIENVIDLKENKDFIDSYFYNLKNNTRNYEFKIGNTSYDVCIDEIKYYEIEQLIVSYIRAQTEKEFKYFIYEKAQN